MTFLVFRLIDLVYIHIYKNLGKTKQLVIILSDSENNKQNKISEFLRNLQCNNFQKGWKEKKSIKHNKIYPQFPEFKNEPFIFTNVCPLFYKIW